MVFEKIKELLANQLGADEESMSMDTNIAADLGADSLDVVELLAEIQDEFQVEIPDEEIENIKTIGDLTEYIQNNTWFLLNSTAVEVINYTSTAVFF